MPQKLTKRVVEALRPRQKPYDARDSEIKGFICRVYPSGLRAFWFVYKVDGRAPGTKLGEFPGLSADGARALAKTAAGELASARMGKGLDPAARKKAEKVATSRSRLLKLETFLDEKFQPWAETHMKSHEEQLARIRSDFADYLAKPMTALHTVAIEGLRQRWFAGGKGTKAKTINRDIQRIHSVLSRAVEWGVLATHPLKGLKPMKADKGGRVRFLSAEEEQALRNALDARHARMHEERVRFNAWRAARHKEPLPEDVADYLRPMVLLALNTGMRRGELFSLLWSDVDLVAGVVKVRAESAKSGQTRRIPLNVEASAVLTAWRKPDAEGLVFPGEGGARLTNVFKSWGGVAKAAGLKEFKFHDLRHTFASRLVQAGTDLNTVRTLLGHSEISTTLVYAHLAPDNLRAAVERVASTAKVAA